jgi:hypothetical protein
MGVIVRGLAGSSTDVALKLHYGLLARLEDSHVGSDNILVVRIELIVQKRRCFRRLLLRLTPALVAR